MSERMHWTFRKSCGCAFGVLECRRELGTDTRSKAWREFYDTASERNEAMDRGVTCDLMTHTAYVATVMPMISGAQQCGHGES